MWSEIQGSSSKTRDSSGLGLVVGSGVLVGTLLSGFGVGVGGRSFKMVLMISVIRTKEGLNSCIGDDLVPRVDMEDLSPIGARLPPVRIEDIFL